MTVLISLLRDWKGRVRAYQMRMPVRMPSLPNVRNTVAKPCVSHYCMQRIGCRHGRKKTLDDDAAATDSAPPRDRMPRDRLRNNDLIVAPTSEVFLFRICKP